MTKINENIAFLRKEKGVTQEELAKVLGVSNQAVSKWESGQCCPDIELLPALAEFFEVSIDDLFGYSLPNSNARSREMDFVFKLRKQFASLPEEDVFETAYRILLLMHEVIASNGYRTELPWDSDNANTKKENYYWNFSACSVEKGSTVRAGNGVYVSFARDYETPSAVELYQLFLTLEKLTKPNALQILYILYDMTAKDFDLYVSAEEISVKAGLTQEATASVLKELPFTLQESENGLCYRIDGAYMHVPSMLRLLRSK